MTCGDCIGLIPIFISMFKTRTITLKKNYLKRKRSRFHAGTFKINELLTGDLLLLFKRLACGNDSFML